MGPHPLLQRMISCYFFLISIGPFLIYNLLNRMHFSLANSEQPNMQAAPFEKKPRATRKDGPRLGGIAQVPAGLKIHFGKS